jgi:hypothetical protein
VKEVKEAVVKSRLQAEGADDAGDAQQILADGHSRQTEGYPQEGPGAGAGGAQFARQIPPLVPEHISRRFANLPHIDFASGSELCLHQVVIFWVRS